jgi:mono/diheme cytochrome c family protein
MRWLMRIDPQSCALAALLLLALSACASPPVAEPGRPAGPATQSAAGPEAAARGLAFAQAHCSRCHAVAANQLSPNPEAPPFEAVVATPGLTRETLTAWLASSHNFPEMMSFSIDAGRIDDLSAYMLTLRERR